MDGSRLRILSGRSAIMGDGPSRHNEEHGRFLREQSHALSNFSVDDMLADEFRPGDWHCWATDAIPDDPTAVGGSGPLHQAQASVGAVVGAPRNQIAAMGGAAGREPAVVALYLPLAAAALRARAG
mgnify:CR=1 FL=1